MGFLSSLQTYGQSWEETAREKLTEEDVKSVKSAKVVTKEQEWGTSVSICLVMKDGGQKFVPLSRDSSLEEGDTVDVKSIEIITLERDGEVIHRADGEVK